MKIAIISVLAGLVFTSVLVFSFYRYFYKDTLSFVYKVASIVMPRDPVNYELLPPTLNQEKVWDSIQEWRKSENLDPYIEDQRLCAIAEDRVLDGDDNHEAFLEKMKSNHYSNKLGIDPEVYISENYVVIRSETNPLEAWLASPQHAVALHDDFKYSCLRCKDNQCNQIFSNFKSE